MVLTTSLVAEDTATTPSTCWRRRAAALHTRSAADGLGRAIASVLGLLACTEGASSREILLVSVQEESVEEV